MTHLTLLIIIFTNLPDFTCEARNSVGISDDSNRCSVENLDRELVAGKKRFEGEKFLQKRRKKKEKEEEEKNGVMREETCTG